jgi:hypothetical protein
MTLVGLSEMINCDKKKYEQQHKVKLNRRVHKTGMSNFDKIQYNYAGAPDNDCEIFTIQI